MNRSNESIESEALRALSLSEATVRALVDASSDAAMLLDREGRFIALNAVTARYLGKPEQALLGTSVWHELPPEFAEFRRARVEEAFRTGLPVEYRDEWLGRQFEHRILPVSDSDGKIPYVVILARDTTDLLRAERDLRRSNRLYSFLGHVNEATLRVRDRDGLLEEVVALATSEGGFAAALIQFGEDSTNGFAWSGATPLASAVEGFPWVRDAVGEVLASGERRILNLDPRGFPEGCVDARSAGLFPFRLGKEVRGVILVLDREADSFNGEEVRLMELVAGNLGFALEVMEREVERHSAEKYVRELSSAVEQAADLIQITDREGLIEYVNPAFTAATGWALEDVRGKTPRILKSGIHPPEFYARMWGVLSAGGVFRGTVVNRSRGGTLFYEEKTITPLRDAAGTITHFVSAGRDITDRIHAEREKERLLGAVARSAKEWRLTFDALNAPILVLGSDGTIRRANLAAADLAGIEPPALVGQRLDLISPSEPWATGLRLSEGALSERLRRAERAYDAGSNRAWMVAASPFEDASTSERFAVVVARETTEMERLHESVRRSETLSAMGRLLAGVAHEVRNPLFAISATLDAFEAEFGGRDTYRQYIDVFRGELERLTGLMEELLEYGRPPSTELRPGSLHEVIGLAVRSCAKTARDRGVTIVNRVGVSCPPIAMARRRLAQVFVNLVENAVLHSPPGGEVVLERQDCDERIAIHVRDSGPGFAPEDLSRVFEPFFTRRKGGTGLGLSIVQRIVDEHHGEVRAENSNMGGADVVVYLPAVGAS